MPNVMIVSLGGSPEPLKKSIEHYMPSQVICLASHESILNAEKAFSSINFPKPEIRFEITENPNILYMCYKAARKCLDRVKRQNVSPEKVVVDYTGGTKVMTAALMLATIGEKYKFNYVGGTIRNKNNVGTVKDGNEEIYAEMSPWSIFAEEERRNVVILFNSRQFPAVKETIDFCEKRELPRQIREYFGFVKPVAEGFYSWDQFNHKVAIRYLEKGIIALENYLKDFSNQSLKGFLTEIQDCKKYLEELLRRTNDLKKYDILLVKDILNNARRRQQEKNYDDATARIYRSLELYGQLCFQEVSGYGNDKLKAEEIPQEIREEFIRKYQDPKSRLLKLPLGATFEYLRLKGHEAGRRFLEKEKDIQKIQGNRNYSILAHGLKPISEKNMRIIFDTVVDFIQIKEFFDLPKLV